MITFSVLDGGMVSLQTKSPDTDHYKTHRSLEIWWEVVLSSWSPAVKGKFRQVWLIDIKLTTGAVENVDGLFPLGDMTCIHASLMLPILRVDFKIWSVSIWIYISSETKVYILRCIYITLMWLRFPKAQGKSIRPIISSRLIMLL